ncbi:MAG TPA: Tex-like N-terminal domain-containing protein, partial [Defluviitoga tunisiensis]|nr:Tex-like N-terminal domain-containing protein [Defluviitoga tunisiensis]
MDIVATITEELNIKRYQTENTIELLNNGNTVPFISRYRKEVTGNLDEEKIRQIEELFNYYKNLEEYKKTVLKSIEEQGKLTPNLKTKILETKKMTELEDLYLPYKKRKKTNADKAVEAGLEPASIKVLVGSLKDLEELQEFITKDYDTIEKVCEGISHIIGQTFAHDKDNRESLRKYYEKNGYVQSEKKKEFIDKPTKYDMYHEFKQEISKIYNYRVLALNRGEKEGVLTVKLVIDDQWLEDAKRRFKTENEICNKIIFDGIDYGFKNMLNPSIEREIRQNLTQRAEDDAI